jgi:hypothetical protein
MLPDAYSEFKNETKNTVFDFIFLFEKQKQKTACRTGNPVARPTGLTQSSGICYTPSLRVLWMHGVSRLCLKLEREDKKKKKKIP